MTPITMTSRARVLAALNGQPVDRVPVFPLVMSMPADRAGLTYRAYATQGQALAEAQLRFQQQFGIDAINAGSDAFRIAADLGGEMAYPEQTPPHLVQPLLRGADDLSLVKRPDPLAKHSRMADRVLSVAEMVKGANGQIAVVAWVDMPFAEACSACGVSEFMMMLVDDPEGAHRILRFLTEIVIEFALAQVAQGPDFLGAGDAAASLLSLPMYREFAQPYEAEVVAAMHAKHLPVKMHICGDTSRLLDALAATDADLFNFDYMTPFARAMEMSTRYGKCYKGNLDPVSEICRSTPEACSALAKARIREARGTKFMLSPGCEPPAMTPDDVFAAFCHAPIDVAAEG
jgi:MtaA/CmuA family methyltransferase